MHCGFILNRSGNLSDLCITQIPLVIAISFLQLCKYALYIRFIRAKIIFVSAN